MQSDSEDLPCAVCGQKAQWLYMPGTKGDPTADWACDLHVPRGCSCNQFPIDDNPDNLDPNNWKQDTDPQGRLLPCCEWWYLHE